MIGIVDVGGGTRGIYGAGIFDYCLDQGIRFDLVIGVSAGSANGASYIAGQRGRNYRFYNDYAFREEYMSVKNLLHTGSYIGLDYIYTTLSIAGAEDPLDYEALATSPQDYVVVATDAATGKPVYFGKSDMKQDDYNILKASSCVPVICPPYPIGDAAYFDGGLSDPIPFRKAFEMGCEKVVVILTKPRSEMRRSRKERILANALRAKYPAAAKALANRNAVYNQSLHEALLLEKAGLVKIIAPDDIGDLKTLTQDHASLEMLYRKAYADAAAIPAFL